MTDQTKLCPHCGMSISESANVCYQCKRSQGSVRSKLESIVPFINVGSIILSVALVSLSGLQFREANKQRNSADRAVQSAGDALKQADAARVDAQQANAEAKMARDEARDAVELLRTNIKLMLELEYLTPNILSESYDPVRAGRVRQPLEKFAVPNEKERKKWRESLK